MIVMGCECAGCLLECAQWHRQAQLSSPVSDLAMCMEPIPVMRFLRGLHASARVFQVKPHEVI